MRFRRFIIAAVVLVSVYAGWEVMYPSGTWRYKLTLVVDDNGRQVVGSGVVQVHMRVNPRITPETGDSFSVKGEAIAVDLGENGVLFSLLRKDSNVDYGYYIVTEMFPPPRGADSKEFLSYYKNLRAKREVPFDKLPMLVRFRDINDPKTVEKVDPNDLAKSFGPGVRFVSAAIEMTDEPVTMGINNKLSWLGTPKANELGEKFFNPNRPGIENYLVGNDFKTGGNQ